MKPPRISSHEVENTNSVIASAIPEAKRKASRRTNSATPATSRAYTRPMKAVRISALWRLTGIVGLPCSIEVLHVHASPDMPAPSHVLWA